MSERVWGKHRGRVVATDDPARLGRVKVAVPAVLGRAEAWAMPCVPLAGPGVGFTERPPVGAHVWVEFEAGDPARPIWVGGFWGAGEFPEA